MITLEKLLGVGRHLEIEKVGKVKLGQKLDDILLTRGIIRISLHTLFPHLLHGSVRAQTDYELVGGGSKTKELIIKYIRKDVPFFAPEKLHARFHRRHQADPEPGDPVPRFAKCPAGSKHLTSIERKSRMPQIRGIKGEAVVNYCPASAGITKKLGYYRLSLRVNKIKIKIEFIFHHRERYQNVS